MRREWNRLKFLFDDWYVVYTCAVCAVAVPDNIGIIFSDEVTVMRTYSGIFYTEITVFDSTAGSFWLVQLEAFTSELLG